MKDLKRKIFGLKLMRKIKICITVKGNSFSERVLQFGFSVKPTLKQILACRMFINGVLLGSNPMEAKEGSRTE